MGRYFATVVIGVCFGATLAAQSSNEFDAIVKSADAARDAGKTDKALDFYQQALHIKPDWKEGWWVMGSMLYDADRYQEGAEAFLPLTVLDPGRSPGWAMAGLCEFETKHYKQALAHLQKSVQLGLPESLYDIVEYHIVLTLIRGGDFEPALEMISRYATRGAENPRLVEAMGIGALRESLLPQDVPPAEHELVMAVGRAMCDAAASHGKESIAELEHLLAAYPNRPQLHYLYGLVLLQSDPDKSLAEFKQELTITPNHPQALINLAAEYVKRDDFQNALPYAEQAVASDGNYFASHAMLGKVLAEGGLDTERGIRELQTAVKMAPDNPQSRLALASAYAKAGRKTDAANERAAFLRLRKEIDSNSSGQK